MAGWRHCFQAIFLCYVILLQSIEPLTEAPDGSVCFNNCSGHGRCEDYTCYCDLGYVGDDCSHTFAAEEDMIVPILTAGDFNLTRKNFTSALNKHKYMLVGFSSPTCHKCIRAEPEYLKIQESLHGMEPKIPFARADTAKMSKLAEDFGVNSVPTLVLFKQRRPIVYNGVHSVEAVKMFVQKQTGKAYLQLNTVESVKKFFDDRNDPKYSLSTVMVVGFFSDHKGIEEDEFEDFVEAAESIQMYADIYIGLVTSKEVCDWYKENKHIDRTPSLFLIDEENSAKSINLDEFYGEKLNIKDWILQSAMPLVGKLTHTNFALYEKRSLPMLMMFLDLEDEHLTSSPGRVVGGRSGGILNENLLEEYRIVAKEHSDRISFVFLDGNGYVDKMRSLGLYGGKERLPSLAFNTKTGSQIPFPESLPINKDTLMQFCADFISGKLQSKADAQEMAKKALQSAVPISKKNTAVRKERKGAPEVKQGVSEQFGDGFTGDDAVYVVDNKNFDEVVMHNDEKDVLLLLHAKSCETCSHFAVYFKRMASRFKDLDIKSLLIARMDVSDEAPPVHANLMVGELPILVLMPATIDDTEKPTPIFYSGVGKIQQMMKWVQNHVAIPFNLPNLPHLNEDQVKLYKEQVREREEAMEKKRIQEEEDMKAEEKAQKDALERHKQRKQQETSFDEKKQSPSSDALENSEDAEKSTSHGASRGTGDERGSKETSISHSEL